MYNYVSALKPYMEQCRVKLLIIRKLVMITGLVTIIRLVIITKYRNYKIINHNIIRNYTAN